MSFWGEVVKNKPVKAEIPEGVVLNLTQVALASGKPEERNTLKVTVDGKTFVVATLVQGKAEQAKVSLLFESTQEVSFQVAGTGEVHLTGYFVENEAEFDDEDMEGFSGFGEDDDDEDDDEEGEDDDDEEESEGLPNGGGKRALPGAQAGANKKLKNEQGAPKAPAKPQAPKQQAPKQAAPKQAPKQAAPKQAPKQGAPKQAPKQAAPKQAPKAGSAPSSPATQKAAAKPSTPKPAGNKNQASTPKAGGTPAKPKAEGKPAAGTPKGKGPAKAGAKTPAAATPDDE